jgi:hypothetical protein
MSAGSGESGNGGMVAREKPSDEVLVARLRLFRRAAGGLVAVERRQHAQVLRAAR